MEDVMTYLAYLRMKRGLKQHELARAFGIHPALFNKIERGWYRKPPRGFEDRCRAFFGPEWTFDRLMAEPPDPEPGIDAA